jgi:hypothetical protein
MTNAVITATRITRQNAFISCSLATLIEAAFPSSYQTTALPQSAFYEGDGTTKVPVHHRRNFLITADQRDDIELDRVLRDIG